MAQSELRPDDMVYKERYENEHSLSDVNPLLIIWQRRWVVALAVILLTGLVLGFSLVQTPTYEASVKLLVGQQGGGDTSNDLYNEVQGLQQISATMVEAVNTRPIAQGVIEKSNLNVSPEAFLENVQAEQVGSTQFIEISYKDADPEKAQRVANTIGKVFSEKVSEVSPTASSIRATVWEPAVVPDSPVSPNPVLNLSLALVLGVMLGVGLAFLLNFLDDEWKSPEEVEQVSGVPTFASIPAFKTRGGKKGRS